MSAGIRDIGAVAMLDGASSVIHHCDKSCSGAAIALNVARACGGGGHSAEPSGGDCGPDAACGDVGQREPILHRGPGTEV